MVWFPTLEAQSYQRYQHRNDPEAGLSRFLTVCDEEGKLLPQALEVLDIAARHHMVVGTGHVGAEEGMALVRAAAERNCTIVLTCGQPRGLLLGGTAGGGRRIGGLCGALLLHHVPRPHARSKRSPGRSGLWAVTGCF